MANNRMFLIHKPSGLGVGIGSRMDWGWYGAPSSDRLNDFYHYLSKISEKGEQDDFLLAMEDCSESDCFDGWKCTSEHEEGFQVFEFA